MLGGLCCGLLRGGRRGRFDAVCVLLCSIWCAGLFILIGDAFHKTGIELSQLFQVALLEGTLDDSVVIVDSLLAVDVLDMDP